MNNPVDILITRHRQTKLWFALFLVSVIGFTWERSRLIAQLSQPTEFVIIDDQTIYLPKSLDFQSATKFHTEQLALAAETLFDRSPKAFDHEERLKRLFDRDSHSKAISFYANEAAQFAAKQIHQKVEIANTKLLQVTNDEVRASAQGQLIRTGIFDSTAFTEVLLLKLHLTFTRNRSIATNGAFPTVVTDFSFETSSP